MLGSDQREKPQPTLLLQVSAHFFLKKLDRKSFRHCRPYTISVIYSLLFFCDPFKISNLFLSLKAIQKQKWTRFGHLAIVHQLYSRWQSFVAVMYLSEHKNKWILSPLYLIWTHGFTCTMPSVDRPLAYNMWSLSPRLSYFTGLQSSSMATFQISLKVLLGKNIYPQEPLLSLQSFALYIIL